MATPAILALLALAAPARSVTFDESLDLARGAPAVAGARAAAETHRRVAGSASALTANPTVTVLAGEARDEAAGKTRTTAEATLLQGWNLSGLGGDRRATLRAEGGVLAAEARAAALSHRLAAAQAWLELWAAQQSLSDSLQEHDIAKEFAARMARAAGAEAFTRAEAADAAGYAAEAHVAAIAAEGEVADRGFLLAVSMGLPAPEPLGASGPLPAPPLPARTGWEALLQAAERLPAVAARRLASDAERSRAVEARAGRGWTLATGVKAMRDGADVRGVQGVVELGLPLFDRGEREAAAPAAASVRAAGEHREAAAGAATELARALHEVEHTREVADATEKELLPAAAENARLREASMRAGETTVLEVLVARRAWAAARARHTRSLAAHAWARVKVWLLLADLESGGRS